MIKRLCDIPGCKKETWSWQEVDVCTGYTEVSISSFETKKYKPFEKPYVSKKDLCEKHFLQWCKATNSIYDRKETLK